MKETKTRYGNIINEQGRDCSGCKEFKLWSSFYRDSSKKNGYQTLCASCKNKREKERFKGYSKKSSKRGVLFKNTERKFKLGDVREDGMVFSGRIGLYAILWKITLKFGSTKRSS